MGDSIKLLIVDDQTLYRDALRELIGHWPEFEVVGDVENGRKAVEFCSRCVPDLILMDVQMPVMDGVKATGAICSKFPDAVVVMLTVSADDKHLFGAIRAGARGYILKDTPSRQLRSRLNNVARGEGALSGVVARKAMKRLAEVDCEPSTRAGVRDYADLTEREAAILKLVAEGLSNEEIGRKLYISTATVKKYLSVLLQKLCLENRVQLAVFAVRNRLV